VSTRVNPQRFLALSFISRIAPAGMHKGQTVALKFLQNKSFTSKKAGAKPFCKSNGNIDAES